MAYDTIKLKSPTMDASVIRRIEQKLVLRSGLDMSSGEVLYELFTGDIEGSWDSRISVIPKHEDWVVGPSGRPQLHACEPYLLIEASAHKAMLGHNVYGGPDVFLDAARLLVHVVGDELAEDMPPADEWTVHRVDVACVFRMRKAAIQEFFDGIQLLSFPRRRKGARKYDTGVHFAGKTTCVKLYHKGSEFAVHDRNRVRGYCKSLFAFHHGKADPLNFERAEKKVAALHRLAENRLRVEVEILSDKLQYDFGTNPKVANVSDAYLQGVYDTEIEKLLREGKQGMDTVRTSREVLRRLQSEYGDTRGLQLYGVWMTFSTLGEDVAKSRFPRATYYRHRTALEAAGVSWRNTNIKEIANDGVLPVDFAPIRSDHRLCFLPARNRPEFNIRRDVLRSAA